MTREASRVAVSFFSVKANPVVLPADTIEHIMRQSL
ncbi:hypothetical protein SAMN05216203_1290 [Marinobacter daqiaonensis]|uniref:Uncharacterized protein n=1 Tax=Marinobacter daqiaonensis TaxID=650891 RepID=A0A1I6HJA2_9GAMM|nr:hypothetical protein SAMN05216203_1290 [Marinobacter daqiaonensis]